MLLTGKARCEPEVREPHLARGRVYQDVLGLEILVHDAVSVDIRHCAGDADREGEEPLHRHGHAEKAVERLAAEVLDHQRRHALVRLEGERPGDGREVQGPSDLVLLLLALESPRPTPPRIEHLEDHGGVIANPDRAIHSRAFTLVKGACDHVREDPLHARVN